MTLSTIACAASFLLATCEVDAIDVHPWLVAGPIDRPPPALAADAPDGKAWCDELLAADDLDRARLDPQDGDALAGGTGAPLAPVIWAGRETAMFGSGTSARVAYAAARIATDRYADVKLEAKSFHRFRVYLDGEQVAEKGKPEAQDAAAPGTAGADLSLEPGTHRLLVRAVFDPAGPADWSFAASLERKAGFEAAAIDTALLPARALAVDDLLDMAAISAVAVSPRGDRVAVLMRRPEVPADFAKTWVEVRDAADLRLVFTSESLADLSGFAWLPDGSAFSYVTRDGDKATVWRRDRDGGAATPVLRDVFKLGAYRWLPGARGLVYAAPPEGKDEKADDRGVKRMRGLVDRWPNQRDIAHLWLAEAGGEDGLTLRSKLVAGDLSVALQDVRQDCGTLLFSRTRYDVLERPYEAVELYELDLATREVRKLIEAKAVGSAFYSGRGDEVLVLAGPSNLRAAGTAGATGATGAIPNDFQTMLYALDRGGGDPAAASLAPLLPEYDPSLEDAHGAADGSVCYARVEDGLDVGVARIDLATRRVTRLPLPFEVAAGMSVSDDGRCIAVFGTSPREPQRLVAFDPTRDARSPATLAVDADRYRRIGFGEVKRFDAKLPSGDTIEGYVHYPRDFDPGRKYPAIVFYYGGTNPVPADFGGRYPRDLWAAHGYVCYSLTPSGATGRGAAFAARHVNDWGERTCAEILASLDVFLAAHPFVDPERLGSIGASYGGFMTLSLLTKTSRFKAAVSHAGISALASYWGEGFWGYSYSAVASADSFPWNARDLYVEKSPLFHADRITTPLLLTHGEADTNVPIGESEQMYTALKLLGKDVEFLKFAGQNHHILSYPVRKLWMKSILAWFDWRLKDEPGWWKKLYPK